MERSEDGLDVDEEVSDVLEGGEGAETGEMAEAADILSDRRPKAWRIESQEDDSRTMSLRISMRTILEREKERSRMVAKGEEGGRWERRRRRRGELRFSPPSLPARALRSRPFLQLKFSRA